MTRYLFLSILAAAVSAGQTPPAAKPASTPPAAATPARTKAAAPARPAAAKTASSFDSLLNLVKNKQSEQTIVRFAEKNGIQLNEDQMLQLVTAGASASLIDKIYVPNGGDKPSAAGKVPASTATAAAAPARSAANVRTSYNSSLAAVSCEPDRSMRQRIIAVQEFDFGASKTTEQALLNTQAAIGKGMMALAIKRISEAKKYRVVERAELEKLMKEQDRGASTRVKQGTGARTGRILGADAILIGTITIYGSDDKKNQVGLGAFGRAVGLGGVKVGKKENKFVVAVNYRLTDAETSEVVASGEARGEALRKGNSVDLGAITGAGGGAASYDMTSSNFLQTIQGEATVQSLDKLIADLNASEQKIPLRFLEASSRIAQINGAKLYISAGSSSGVRRCDRFVVSRIEQEIKDPVTKEVIDLQLRKIGEFLATEVRDKAAIGFFEGTEQPQEGDMAEKIKPAEPAESKPVVEAKPEVKPTAK